MGFEKGYPPRQKETKYRLKKVTHTQTIKGQKVVTSRWWLHRPDTHPRPWLAEHVGTWDECIEAMRRVLHEGPTY